MKTKKIKIIIKSLDEALEEFAEVAEKIEQGKEVTPKKDTYVADPETARAIFTESRLKIVQLLKNKQPKSIYALAKLLNRDFKNVYDDIMFLTEIGIVGITENKTGRKQKQPKLLCENILFEIAA